MKINVEGVMPTLQKNVIEVVEGIENPKFTYVPNGSFVKTTIVFETESEDEQGCCDLIKKTIKSSEIGRTISFRVIKNGKLY
ncbi:hypothetical protein [Traorella massiliensis]|uniref:hypothetical protein n=1 Tax=Traorella massiliensis TaxID=1903263 RepID=UPI00248E7AFA|nr:hypothetical protein [Traorella massiliensis]